MSVSIPDVPVLILSGGMGARAGGPKGLIEYNGRPWLEAQLGELNELGAKRAVIVLGHFHRDFFRAIPWLEKAAKGWHQWRNIDVSVVVNRIPEQGQFSSLQTGARWLLELCGITHAYMIPIDVPVPNLDVWNALGVALQSQVKVCIPVWENRGGHPVLLSSDFLNDIIAYPNDAPDARLDYRIHALNASEVRRVMVSDPRVGMNINYLDQWKDHIA